MESDNFKKTFKHYLVEFDRSDLQLQQDHQQGKQDKTEYDKSANDFRDQMKNKNAPKPGEPAKGDVLQSPSGKQFVILDRTDSGLRVRELGGNGKEGKLPHGRKYTPTGKTPLNKTIFKLS